MFLIKMILKAVQDVLANLQISVFQEILKVGFG